MCAEIGGSSAVLLRTPIKIYECVACSGRFPPRTAKGMNVTAKSADPGNTSEIQSLVLESQRLGNAVDRWNDGYVWLGAIALLVAFLVFFAQFRIIRKGRELSIMQTALLAAKDRQLKADLEQKDNEIAGANKKAGDANERAATASATAKGFEAQIADSAARVKASEAQIASANAASKDAVAKVATAEAKAESFRLDIAKANEKAAEAQAQVAGATAEAAKANLELERIKAPRTLSNIWSLTESLKAYKGTEYTFSSVFGDEESILLLRQIDTALINSGWVRVKPPHAYPAINVYGREQDFAVASGLTFSVKISVNSDIPLVTLQAIPVDKLPAPTGAAVALAMALTGSLNPPQEGGIKANVEPGNSYRANRSR